jgi:heme A synthase
MRSKPVATSFGVANRAGFARFAWGLLAYDVAVAAWGAYVRATGSGAGCGRHWPLCNGEVVPRAPRVETLVELSHRVSSGAALVATLVLFGWALRAYPARHVVRRAAAASAAFMVAEALIGAALVLFALVAHDASATRVLSVSLHLVNTFLLLGATALTAWWASGGAPVRLRGQGVVAWAALAPLVAVLAVGTTGALTALGDTLFPSANLASGLVQDLDSSAPWLVRLRAFHPVLASATALLVILVAPFVRARRPGRASAVLSRAAVALVVVQVGAGLLDVVSLAPVWLQLAHLVLADGVWIALVLAGAAALSAEAGLPSRPLPPPERAPRGLPGGLGEREGEA